jgi:hypothetical protein
MQLGSIHQKRGIYHLLQASPYLNPFTASDETLSQDAMTTGECPVSRQEI